MADDGSLHRLHIPLLASLPQKPITSHPPEAPDAFLAAKQPPEYFSVDP